MTNEKERTTIMSPDEGTIYPSSSITQLKVGQLDIRGMAFPSRYPEPHIEFSHEITIRAEQPGGSPGWGNELFKGTLKELIDLIRSTKEG